MTQVAQVIYKFAQQGTKTDLWQKLNINGVTLHGKKLRPCKWCRPYGTRVTAERRRMVMSVSVKAVMPQDKIRLEDWDTRRGTPGGTKGASAIDDQGNS